jgi:hypothetical protein
MASPKAISFVAGILLLGTVLSFIMGGVWFDANTKSIFGSLTMFKDYNILGFHMPWINYQYFTVGIPKLFQFNFAFFGGSAGFFKYLLYVFSIGIIWGIVVTFIGYILNFFGSRR